MRIKNIVYLLLIAVIFPGCYTDKLIIETPNGGDENIRKGPYLIYMNNNTSMKVRWQTITTPSISEIEWGETINYGSGLYQGISLNDNIYELSIGNLNPGTIYYYRIKVDSFYHTGKFKTAPEYSQTSLTFYAYGDTRSSPENHNRVLSKMLNDIDMDMTNRNTILIHTGDFVNYGLEESYWDNEYFYRDYMETPQIQARIPIMGAMGNHEKYLLSIDTAEENRRAGELLKKYFNYPMYVINTPAKNLYYSFDYGPVHFTIIDVYTADFSAESFQYNWINTDLSATNKQWKIAAFHIPAYATTVCDSVIYTTLSPLFESKGVKVVLQGHQHYYARCEANGIQYLTLGGGGAPLASPLPINVPSYVTVHNYRMTYHFARLEINGNSMQITVIDKDGVVIETITINQ